MAKNEKQKLKLLYLKQILEEYTDENHGLTMERLLGLLEQKGIKAERKSIYDDIFVLAEDFNMGIELDKSKRPPEYKLLDRQFELPELKMMVDSIASSKFLSEAKTKTLIQKLETLCSSYQARALNREVTLANRVKSMNNTIHINVDQLHAAIAENTQVKFRYFDYDLNKQRRYFKKGECYVVSPWRMLYADDNYYLLAWDAKEEKFKHFRVDKMDGVEQVLLGNIKVVREGAEAFAKLDMSAYAPTVCYTCLGLHTFTCPYCQQESYEEFSYGKVMRDDPDSKIGNLYKVRGYVVETEKIIDNTSHLTIEIPVNDKTNITCSAIYCPIQELKILPGDEVILYAYLFDVDSKDSLPTFVVPRAELAE